MRLVLLKISQDYHVTRKPSVYKMDVVQFLILRLCEIHMSFYAYYGRTQDFLVKVKVALFDL